MEGKNKPYWGVYNYLLKHYPEVFKGTAEHPETRPHSEVVNGIMVEYIREILELPFKEDASNESLIFNATTIQNNWIAFKEHMAPEFDY